MSDAWLTRIQAANMLRPQTLSDEQARTIAEQRQGQLASIPEALSKVEAPGGLVQEIPLPANTWTRVLDWGGEVFVTYVVRVDPLYSFHLWQIGIPSGGEYGMGLGPMVWPIVCGVGYGELWISPQQAAVAYIYL